MTLAIHLLGSMTVKLDGQTLALPTRKAEMILAYLALNAATPVSRERLAAYLWPESESALGNLRAELVRLRQRIGDPHQEKPLLRIDRRNITLDPKQATIDTWQIDQLLAQCAAHRHPITAGCEYCAEKLAQAIDLYEAPLLEEMLPPGSAELAEDMQIRQSELESRILAALETLQTYLSQLGRHAQVISYAQRHLSLQPGAEAATRRLMMAYTLSGNRQSALNAYAKLYSYLEEVDTGRPSPDLTRLYEQIRSHRVEANTPPPLTSPYPGLAAFGPDNAHYFYGHESLIDRLAEAVSHHPLALLTGPSGSGKSSLIYAGLLPGLARQSGQGGTRWSVSSFRPGRDPLQNLAQAICAGSDAAGVAGKLNNALAQGQVSLGRIVVDELKEASGEPDSGQMRVLLVVDQFEEIFTLCADEQVRRFFLTGLFDSLAEETANLSVLIVLRADFLGQALTYHSFSTIPPENVHFLGRMNNAQLQRAIEEPARQHGIAYEPGLVERILVDLDDAPGQLPLLQFALTLLWEARTDQWITNAAYNEIEQVSGALTHYADGIYARLELAEQERVRRIFLQLVRPGENTEDTRRLASRTEIGEESWPLVHKLADSRLVVTSQDASGQETVEVIHEALIQQWGRLRTWLDEDRVFRLWQTKARTTLNVWMQDKKDKDMLLRGLLLAEAERWLQERGDDLDTPLIHFIQASALARDVQEAKERQHSQELEAALAESRRLERRALARQLAAQSIQAMQTKTDLALLLSLEALQRSDLIDDRSNLLTSLEVNPFLNTILHGHTMPVIHVAFTADGTGLVSVDANNRVLLWNIASRSQVGVLVENADQVGLDTQGRWVATAFGKTLTLWDVATRSSVDLTFHTEEIFRLHFSPDGSRLLSVGMDGELLVWDPASGLVIARPHPIERDTSSRIGPEGRLLVVADVSEETRGFTLRDGITGRPIGEPMTGHTGPIHGMSFSPDGTYLASASFDGTVGLWATAGDAQASQTLIGHTGRVLFAVFSQDGGRLVSGGTDRQLLVWDVATGQRAQMPPLPQGNWLRCAAFSPDDRLVAVGDADGKIFLWDMATQTVLSSHTDRVRAVAVSPDGKNLATASFDYTIGVWDTASHTRQQTLRTGSPGQWLHVAFSPDGRTLASIGELGAFCLWDTKTWQARSITPSPRGKTGIALAFSPDSSLVATGDFAGYATLWDVATGQPIGSARQLHSGASSWVSTLAFSPDGRLLASGSTDTTIRLWRVPELTPLPPVLQGHSNWITDLLFNGDGTQLISASSDGTVRTWDVATHQPSSPPLTGHQAQVWQVEFSPTAGEDVLVSLDADGSIIWWDRASQTAIGPPLRTGTETECMALSPDGKWLYLGSFGKDAQAWRLSQQPWVERALQIANRSLTSEERKTYLGDEP